MDLDKLKKKRTIVRQLKTKLINKLEALLDENIIEEDKQIVVYQLEEFKNQLSEKSITLKSLNSEIEELLPAAEIEMDVEASEEIQEKIISSKLKIEYKIRQLSLTPSTPFVPSVLANSSVESNFNLASQVHTPVQKTYVKLPKLSISKFFGDPCDYLEFKNQFDSAIGNNDSLSKVDKFNYLKTLLGGSAANVINGFSLTEANYDSALKLLEDRFGRRDILISSHMNKLLNLEPVRNSSNIPALRRLYESCEIQIRSLDALEVCSGTYGQLLCPILLKLIPEDLTLQFNRARKNKSDFDVKELIAFIQAELECREASVYVTDNSRKNQSFNPMRNGQGNNKNFRNNESNGNNRNFRNSNIPTATALVSNVQNSCIFCNATHETNQCQMQVEEKINKLKREGRCLRCFKKGHKSYTCRVAIEECSCGKRNHAKEICRSNFWSINDSVNDTEAETAGSQVVVSSVSHAKPINDKIASSLLQTCSVNIKTNNDTTMSRILLDNASQRSFITQSLARELKLKILREEQLLIYSFGNRDPIEKTFEVSEITLENRVNPKLKIKLQVLLTDLITAGEVQIPDNRILDLLKSKNVKLADVSGSAKEVEILLGADVYWDVFSGKVEKISRNLTLIETIFGNCLQGHLEDSQQHQKCSVNLTSVINNSSIGIRDVNSQLRDFWTLKNMGIIDEAKDTNEESETMRQFEKNTVFKNGRYETKLMWKDNYPNLDNNFQITKKRFQNLSSKLLSDKKLFNEYKAILDEQLREGIIEDCSQEIKNDKTFYLPNAPVVCLDKITTKVRIIFDGSSKTKNSISLNDCSKVGPNLNPNILDVILNFRKHKIAFCTDIEKAFLQIVSSEEDRDYLRFLWYKNDPKKNKSWKIFRITRNPFGLKCSPFILATTIKLHIKQYETDKKETFDMLNHSLYLDDLFHGHSDVQTAFDLSNNAVKIMKDANMNLRKFHTNSSELRELWVKNGIIQNEVTNENSLKVLGIKGDNDIDVLRLDIQSVIDCIPNLKNTKRCVLQTAAKILDPVGFLSPFVTRIKCLFQELWERGLDRDEELPIDLKLKWDKWCSEVGDLRDFAIPREYFPIKSVAIDAGVQLHIFSDDNPNAHRAVAYLSCNNGHIETSFAPFKYKEKYSALLPSRHKFTELIVARSHQLVRHSGVADTPTQVRGKFWIVRGRQVIKSNLNKCLISKRYNSRKGTQMMAPLPANGITEAPPFSITGLDFADPLYTKNSDSKYYICIFACSVTRAIHLELVPNQNTETLQLAFCRFTLRRGICSTMYSDNAKTFKSVEKWLAKMWKLGRIVEVYPGRDGKVRSCAIKTVSGIIRRPVQLICPMEI